MDLGNLNGKLHGIDGNTGYINSLSNNDINKLRQALQDIEQLKENIESNDFALKSGNNEFTGDNSFSVIPTITASQQLSTLSDNDVVKGQTLKELSSDVGNLIANAFQVNYQETPPKEEEIQEKVFTICPSLDLLI